MNGTLSKVFIFAAGAAIGSVVTWKLLKTKYEQLAQEEIESVIEVFSNRQSDDDTEHAVEDEPDTEVTTKEIKEKPDLREYAAKLAEKNYTNYADVSTVQEKEEKKVDGPYVITPDEFGERDEYETTSLTYYADGVLTDDADEIIDNVDEIVGEDSLKHFGEYEDDSVFVRNDNMKCDYEILLDTRRYADIYTKYPHDVEE